MNMKFNWSRIRTIALLAIVSIMIVGYVGVGVGVLIHDNKFADGVVLCPSEFNDTHDVSLKGIKRQSLVIPTGDGQKLDAWLFVVPGATKLTIVNHGNAGNLTSRGLYAQVFAQFLFCRTAQ
jgi:hypothetical protein